MYIKFLKSCFHGLALTICIFNLCIVGEVLLTCLRFQSASPIQQDLFTNFILQSNCPSSQFFFIGHFCVYSFHHGWYQQSSIRAQNKATDACLDTFPSFARKSLVIVPESSFSDSPAPVLLWFNVNLHFCGLLKSMSCGICQEHVTEVKVDPIQCFAFSLAHCRPL